jgi:hypothetical protein
LDTENEHGSTLRQEYLQAYKHTGKLPERLTTEVNVPACLMHIWEAFSILSKRRDSDGFSGTPLSIKLTEIHAFTELFYPLSEREIKLLILLDDTFKKYHGSKCSIGKTDSSN